MMVSVSLDGTGFRALKIILPNSFIMWLESTRVCCIMTHMWLMNDHFCTMRIEINDTVQRRDRTRFVKAT